ncbi:unnamed protein product [Polarella glacialis]|uniref:Alpha-type protein kinase domain-containing protein n=1 Tax=Polarella glacialis TaxID=89957 RepID=A0A813JC04_POLGL|nr:unnamed protein product [Polarella glacialis]
MREVTFEPPDQWLFSNYQSLTFRCERTWFTFGPHLTARLSSAVKGKCDSQSLVSLHLHPFTQGGMRFVYCFRDLRIRILREQGKDAKGMTQAGTDARIVAKLSKYVDPWHNSLYVVAAYSHSNDAAKFHSKAFMLAAANKLGATGLTMAKIIFVEWQFNIDLESDHLPSKFMAAERYLLGVFLKYNSNKGYVDFEAPGSEIAQAFSHFTYRISQGKMIVLDLQGVHLDKAFRRRPHLILTDPQVVSPGRSFGPGDLGLTGIKVFFRSHRCGPTCKGLGLDTLPPPPLPQPQESSTPDHNAKATASFKSWLVLAQAGLSRTTTLCQAAVEVLSAWVEIKWISNMTSIPPK